MRFDRDAPAYVRPPAFSHGTARRPARPLFRLRPPVFLPCGAAAQQHGARGIAPAQLEPLLASLQAHRRDCRRGGLLFAAGESVDELGLVLRGSVHIVYEDVFGERSIINTMAEGQIFCGAFSCAGTPLPVSILAQTDCTVLLIRTRYLLEDGPRGADGQPLLAQNLLQVLASLYVALVDKVIHLSRRTTRQKLLSYLAAQQQLTGGGAFSVPYSRQELAEFLFVERSGLST